MSEKNRLSKILAQCGIASRRAAEALIFEGRVCVNGEVVTIPQTFVSIEEDEITVNGNPVLRPQDKVYYILNKPPGYICTSKRPGSKRIVTDLFAGFPYRLFTVGRLDRETSGLLLVTNDGHFANSVIHPSSGIDKEYLVKTTQEITAEHLEIISKGALVEGVWVKPKKLSKVRKGTLKIIIAEGKKREIRNLVEQAGLTILSLSRIRIGGLHLGNLPLGTFREMTKRDKELLFE